MVDFKRKKGWLEHIKKVSAERHKDSRDKMFNRKIVKDTKKEKDNGKIN